jgi:hypothetical protein
MKGFRERCFASNGQFGADGAGYLSSFVFIRGSGTLIPTIGGIDISTRHLL